MLGSLSLHSTFRIVVLLHCRKISAYHYQRLVLQKGSDKRLIFGPNIESQFLPTNCYDSSPPSIKSLIFFSDLTAPSVLNSGRIRHQTRL